MKIIVSFVAFVFLAILLMPLQGCHFAYRPVDGDTVAASVFEPEDTALTRARAHKSQKTVAMMKDSMDIFTIGEGSTRKYLQLVSYPTGRDTLLFGKIRHVKVKGCADIGKVVRVKFYVKQGKDSLVSEVEQIQ